MRWPELFVGERLTAEWKPILTSTKTTISEYCPGNWPHLILTPSLLDWAHFEIGKIGTGWIFHSTCDGRGLLWGDHKVPSPNSTLPPLPEDRAAILFAELDVAQARGDYAQAAEVQRQLREIGWVVTRRRPRPDAGKAVSPCQ